MKNVVLRNLLLRAELIPLSRPAIQTGSVIILYSLILFNFKEVDGNVPIRHFYSPCGTKTTLLHLSPTSSRMKSSMQSGVTLDTDHSLVEDMICASVTIRMLVIRTAILDVRINFLRTISLKVNKPGAFLLANISL